MTRLALDVKTFAQASADLAAVLDAASAARKPLVIAREDGEPVDVVPLSVWNALAEEEASDAPVVSERLRESIAELDAGGGVKAKLDSDGHYMA